MLVAHHQIDGVVGTEEVQHPHHMRMNDGSECPAFVKETFQTDAIQLKMLRRHGGLAFALGATGQCCRQVLFNGDRMPVFVLGEVHNAKAADRDLLYNAVSADFYAIRQGCVVLNGHFLRTLHRFPGSGLCGFISFL